MIQKLTRRISWRVSFFAYISKSLSLISICWRVCQKELDLYAGFHYNKKQRRMNLRENVFTYSEIYENDEKKDMQTKKDTKIMRVRALLVFCITFLITIGCIYLVNLNQEKREKLKASYTAETTVGKVEAQLNKYLSESELMKKLIEEKHEITDEEFSELSQLMQDENYVISAHELAKDGAVSQVYPLEGNEQAIGLDILRDSERKVAANTLSKLKKQPTLRKTVENTRSQDHLIWYREESEHFFLIRFTQRMNREKSSSGDFLFWSSTGINLSRKQN